MITIFTTPKPFKDEINIIQRNAILSWKKLRPEPEIILLGDDEGVKEVAKEFNVLHVSEIKKNDFGTPLVSDIFEKAQKIAKNIILAYVNADIILMNDFLRAVEKIEENKFLMVGKRTDLDVFNQINFEKTDWQKELLLRAEKEGKLHGPAGIDYFVFPKGFLNNIPSFALGRTAWDNWLLYYVRSQKVPLIDASKIVKIIHQNHQYLHNKKGKAGIWTGPEAQKNLTLTGGDTHLLTIRDANFVLTNLGLKKQKFSPYHLFIFSFYNFERVFFLNKIFLFPGWLAMLLLKKLKRNLINLNKK